MSEIDPNGGLAKLLAEHKEKKAQLEQEAAALREIAQADSHPGVPVPGVTLSVPTPGPLTSEGQRTKWQQIIGGVLAVAGSIVAMLSAARPDNQLLAGISAVIAAIGGAMGNQAASSYANTRATIKTGGGV